MPRHRQSGDLGEARQRMWTEKSLIHNITYYLAMASMANTLLVKRASPAMIQGQDELAEFVSLAAALAEPSSSGTVQRSLHNNGPDQRRREVLHSSDNRDQDDCG